MEDLSVSVTCVINESLTSYRELVQSVTPGLGNPLRVDLCRLRGRDEWKCRKRDNYSGSRTLEGYSSSWRWVFLEKSRDRPPSASFTGS